MISIDGHSIVEECAHGLPGCGVLQLCPLLQTNYGFIPWDDSHHPYISQTDMNADGCWIYINAKNTPRIARIDLKTFETKEILELPNTGGNHASSFVTENSEYVIGATRFSIPYEIPLGYSTKSKITFCNHGFAHTMLPGYDQRVLAGWVGSCQLILLGDDHFTAPCTSGALDTYTGFVVV